MSFELAKQPAKQTIALTTRKKTSNVAHQVLLLVDDDPRIRMLWSELLHAPDRLLLEAEDVEAALHILAEQPVDLVVTDVIMPGRSGLELLQEIKQVHSELPCLLVTGNPDYKDAVASMKWGAVDYLDKLSMAAKLPKMVEDILTRKAVQTSTDGTQVLAEKWIAGYRVLGNLGNGAMGTVYLVECREKDQTIQRALKMLHPPPLSSERKNRELLERFLREAEILSRLKHPNIVPVYDWGIDEEMGAPYLIMEYIEGMTLKRLMAQNTELDYQRKAAIIRDLALALFCVHTEGLCHRDIKPSNVLISHGMNVKLFDFGTVRMYDSSLTQTDQLMGTPAYMAPESLITAKVDYRADIFSLGVLAYELFLGKLPFDATEMGRLMYQICNETPPPANQIDPDFPLELQQILERMLQKKPTQRYRDCAEVSRVLQTFIEGKTENRILHLFRQAVRPILTTHKSKLEATPLGSAY